MGVRSQIVAYCRKQLGCAYSYTPSGGKEGSSYNCSYLSTCAYKAAGLTIPRWQGHQNGDGSQSDWVYRNGHWTTDPAKLKPGDLVFFGSSRTNTGHVGVVSRAGSTPYIIDSTPSRGVAERKLPVSAGFVGGGWAFGGGKGLFHGEEEAGVSCFSNCISIRRRSPLSEPFSCMPTPPANC